MSYLPSLVSVIALLAASAVVLRVPSSQLHWSVAVYVVAQCAFHFVAWLNLQRKSASTPHYLIFFTVGYAGMLLLAMIACGRMVGCYPPKLAFAVMGASAIFAAVLTLVVGRQALLLYSGDVPFATGMLIAQGGVLMFCGLTTALTLFEPTPPAMHTAAIAFAAYWIFSGLFAFGFSIGIVRTFGLWLRLNNFIPAMIVIVAFSWLALRLSTLQHEGSRELVPTSAPATAHARMEHV